jgi:hypothetical protein
MPEILLFIIVVVVVGIVIVYVSRSIPTPWSWGLIAIYAVIVLAWFGRILHLW